MNKEGEETDRNREDMNLRYLGVGRVVELNKNVNGQQIK